jgi:serine/threonine protein kinase
VRIVHRDIKSDNILVTSDYRAKLGDLGLSEKLSGLGSNPYQQQTEGIGSLLWRAPETMRLPYKFRTACDVYSAEIVLWEIASRARPFDGPERLISIGKLAIAILCLPTARLRLPW